MSIAFASWMQYICCTNTVTYRSKLNKMSDIAIASLEKLIPDDLKAYINGLVEIKLEKAVGQHTPGRRMITRTQCILETNRRFYDEGVRSGFLNPSRGKGRNSEHFLYLTEWDAYFRSRQFKRNS